MCFISIYAFSYDNDMKYIIHNQLKQIEEVGYVSVPSEVLVNDLNLCSLTPNIVLPFDRYGLDTDFLKKKVYKL